MKKFWQVQQIIFLVALLVILPLYSFAQVLQKDYRFKSITTEDGLSNNVVFDIYQDKEGFMWFATNNGLNRYDGYSIKTFFHSKTDDTSISSNIVRTIIEDSQGQLWVGTKNGLNLFNREKQIFEKPIHFLKASFLNQEISNMCLDLNGRIWISTLNDVGFFNPKSKKLQLVFNLNELPHISVSDNAVWVSNKNGLKGYYDIKSQKLELLKSDSKSENGAVFFGKKSSKLWLSKNNPLKIDPSRIRYLPPGLITTQLLEITDEIAWLGTDNGLFEYNFNSKALKEITTNKSTLVGQIRALYEDNHRGVWVGTLGGVFHYDPYRKEFHHKDIVDNYDDIVMALHTDSDGIYANALGKDIYFKSYDSTEFKEIRLPKTFPEQGLFIWDFETVPESDFPLWMSTNDGLICLNPENSKINRIKIPISIIDENVSFSLLDTNQDFLWVASHKAIHKVVKKDAKLLSSFSLDAHIKYSGIQKIINLGYYIFIATEGEGLFAFDTRSNKTLAVGLENNQALDTSIWDLFTSGNTLWIGTNKGLYSLDISTMEIMPVIKDNQTIFSLTQDKYGGLWMGSDKGIKSYNPKNQKIRYYSSVDGIKNKEFNRKSVITTKNGELHFGGVDGITSFNPENIKKDNPNIPYVHITNLKVVTSDSVFNVPNFKNEITLPWKHNTIEIEYVGLNYTNSAQNKYKYIMEGHDPSWVNNIEPNKARYVKLPIGNYTFKVNASNNDGVWSNSGDFFSIRVAPPIWRTNTAYLVYIIILFALIWLFKSLKTYKDRVTQVEKEKEIIAKKVEEKFIVLNNKTKVYLKTLKYIKAAGNYLEFYTENKTIIDRNKIKIVAEQLPPNFIRTHRSFIINKNYIISSNSTTVVIKPNIETPLSRTFKGSLV